MTLTLTAPYPMTCENGYPFYVHCARCGKEKSSTDVSCAQEIPWKYFCQMCVTFVMLDAKAEGKVVSYEGQELKI